MIPNKNILGCESDIRNLIDRYMAGDTSNAEEAALREWFRASGDAVPEEWRPLKALFGFVDDERVALEAVPSATEPRLSAIASSKPRPAISHVLREPRLWIPSAVAAAAVVAALVVQTFAVSAGATNYAVIDGRVYTNPAIVEQQAISALQTVAPDDDPFSALDMMQ